MPRKNSRPQAQWKRVKLLREMNQHMPAGRLAKGLSVQEWRDLARKLRAQKTSI